MNRRAFSPAHFHIPSGIAPIALAQCFSAAIPSRGRMRPLPLLAALAVVSLILAGCAQEPVEPTGPPAPQKEPDWAVRAIFAGADPDDTGRLPDHDHANRSLHQGLTTPNVEVVGYTELQNPYFGGPAGTNFCGDASAAGERQIALVHSHLTDVAFSVIDVTNHAAPVLLGELVLPLVFVYDVAVFPDARYAVLAANPDLTMDKPPAAGTPEGFVPLRPIWRDACGNEEPAGSTVDYMPYGYSTLLVDLADVARPKVVDHYPYANGRNVHSISASTIDDTRFVATSGLQALPCTVPGISGTPIPPGTAPPCNPAVPRYGNLLSHYDFLTVEETEAGAKLSPYAFYVPSGERSLDPDLISLSNGHTDATLQRHPKTGETIGYLANWDGGLQTVRLDGPGQVTPLSVWGEASPAAGGDPSTMSGNIHTARPVDGLHEGRHLTITGQEVVGRPTGRSTGQVVILDTTDPANPIPVARWTNPVDFTWPGSWGLRFSTHYAILVDNVLYVATYHGGVWAVDARPSEWPELPSLGVLIPDRAPTKAPFHPSDTPEILEVLDLGGGTIAAFDADTGAYTFRFHRDHMEVPPALPWTEDAWIGK